MQLKKQNPCSQAGTKAVAALLLCAMQVLIQVSAVHAQATDLSEPKSVLDNLDSDPTSEESKPASGSASEAPDNLTIDDIKVEGNRLVPTEDILGVVKTKPGDKFSRDKVVEDLKAINNLGYFDDRNMQVVPELTGSGVLLKIRVQENEPVTQFAFQGNKVLSTDEISKAFSDQLGKPQNLSQLSQAIDKVEQAYHEKGYLLARVVDVKDDPDGSIGMTINEGEIESVQIVGNRKTKDFIIKNAIKVKPGSVYNERDLTNDLRKLYGNGYFQDIRRSLVPSTTSPDKYTLKVEVEEKRTGSIGLGGGVDTIAGPFGSMTFSDSNFMGRGQVVQFSSQVGTGMLNNLTNSVNNAGTGFLSNRRTYQVEANWIEPNLKGTKTSMAVSGFARDFNSMLVDYAQQRTLGASVTFSHPLGHNVRGNLGFTGENTNLIDAASMFNQINQTEYLAEQAMKMGLTSNPLQAQQIAGAVRNQQLQGGTYMTVNPSLTYDTRDTAADPTSGTSARLTGSPSLGLGNASFARLGASVTKYVKVNESSGFAFNMQGGTALGGMPQFAQYRLGGWNGLRGYRSFSDLGTGTSMLMASAEYRFKLPIPKGDPKSTYGQMVKMVHSHVKGEFFADAGQVNGNTLTNDLYQRSMLGASVGMGVRLKVPMVGIVRLDYGFPLISSVLGRMTPRFTIGFGDKF
jgi:outer membrane protein insertion porin family